LPQRIAIILEEACGRRIDLTDSKDYAVTVSSRNQKRMPQVRILTGLVHRLGLFEQRPQQDAHIAA
jgi:hypothetical protein